MRIKSGITVWSLLLVMLIGLVAFSCTTASDSGEKTSAVKEAEGGPKEITKSGVGRYGDYTYELWNQDNLGNVTMTLQENSTFDIKWSGIFNMLARVGIRPGNDSTKVTYNVDSYYANAGLSYLCVYGWTYNKGTQDNLVEFYIVDNWKSYRPPGGNPKGTVTVDGDVYEIYTSKRIQQPSILGTKTFEQYWSVRKRGQERTSGTIDIAAHFNAWKELDMTFGDYLYEISFCIEGFESNKNGSGGASITELRFE